MRLICLLLAVVPVVCGAESIYYCMCDGRKVVTDQPCGEKSMELKRVDSSALPPINTSNGLTDSERQRAANFDQKFKQQQVVDEELRRVEQARYAANENVRKAFCNDLYIRKSNVVARQRMGNSDALNQEHRQINDDIYRLKCGN